MTTRSPLSIAVVALVLTATFFLAPASPAVAQGLEPAPGIDTPRLPAVPERTAFPRPTGPAPLETAVDAGHGPAPEQLPRTPELRRIVDVAIVTLGSALVAGALTDYAAGSVQWGMTAPELGAFGAGAALAAWGGLRVAGWSGGAR